jgi:TetR/AcrR family acrAB operon transcriptional repressor
MAKKTKREAQATRIMILEAAARVLLFRGIARTSLLDVAREAGVTRGAVYWHFENKEHILRTLWEDILRENDSFFKAMDGQNESDPLGYLVEQLFGYFKRLPQNSQRQRLFRLLLNEHNADGLGRHFLFNKQLFQQERVRTVAALLTAAIVRKQLPPSIDVTLGAIALIAYVDGLAPKFLQLVKVMDVTLETPFLVNGLMQLLRFGCQRQKLADIEENSPGLSAPVQDRPWNDAKELV